MGRACRCRRSCSVTILNRRRTGRSREPRGEPRVRPGEGRSRIGGDIVRVASSRSAMVARGARAARSGGMVSAGRARGVCIDPDRTGGGIGVARRRGRRRRAVRQVVGEEAVHPGRARGHVRPVAAIAGIARTTVGLGAYSSVGGFGRSGSTGRSGRNRHPSAFTFVCACWVSSTTIYAQNCAIAYHTCPSQDT